MAHLLSLAPQARELSERRVSEARVLVTNVDGSPSNTSEVINTRRKTPKKPGATGSRGYSITALHNDSPTAKVLLVVKGADGQVESNVECFVLGMSNDDAALSWEDDEGVIHFDTIATSDLPQRTRRKVIMLTTRSGADQEILGVQISFFDSDFSHCEVTLPDGTSENAFVITKDCPLFGKTCDGDMKQALISCLTCWKLSNSNQRIMRQVISSPIR